MHQSLVYLSVVVLGLIIVLVFTFFAIEENFVLRDTYISVKLNGTYPLNMISFRDSQDLHYYSENPNIATIDDKGNVEAHNLGETNIIVKSKYKLFKRIVTVRVSNFSVYSIVFEEENIKLNNGNTYTLNPILNGDSNIRSNLEYTSSNDSVATVSPNGTIMAIETGITTITATDKQSHVSSSINVLVNQEEMNELAVNASDIQDEEEEIITASEIKLNSSRINMYIGDVRKLSAVVLPSNVTIPGVTFSSSDTKIATVDKDGMITAKGTGICNIFVNSNDGVISTSILVKVIGNKVRITGLNLEKKEINLSLNELYLIKPVITPTNASDIKINYISSNSDIASVDSTGLVHANNPGTATILAISRDGNKLASMNINVSDKAIKKNNIFKVNLKNYKTSMISGNTYDMEAVIMSKDGNKLDYFMTSSNQEVIRILAPGKVQAVAAGMAFIDIYTSDNSYHDTKLVTVLPGVIEPESIYINKTNVQIVKGKTFELVANVNPENASKKEITWSSSNNKIATVSSKGVVKANGVGTVTITATAKGTGIKRNVRVVVVNNSKLIDVRNRKLIPYYINFKVYDKGTSNMRAMQNFTIANYGSNNPIVYVSFPAQSTIPKGVSATKDLKKKLMQTIIVRIPKSEFYKPGSKSRSYMFLNNAGHGQSLDLDKDASYIWTNGSGYVEKDSKGIMWGRSKSTDKVKYKANKDTSGYTPAIRTYLGQNNVLLKNPEVAFDWDNDLAAIRSGINVSIYKASDLNRNKHTLIYSFNIANKAIDGTNYSRQGHDLANGYYYQYRGYVGSKMYIEAYNYAGELIYTYIFNPGFSKQESEGLKIYNNRIYIGITKNCAGCNGKSNNIYFFE